MREDIGLTVNISMTESEARLMLRLIGSHTVGFALDKVHEELAEKLGVNWLDLPNWLAPLPNVVNPHYPGRSMVAIGDGEA